jgi:hypothetical protein
MLFDKPGCVLHSIFRQFKILCFPGVFYYKAPR